MLKNIYTFFLAHLVALIPLSIHYGATEGGFAYVFLVAFGNTIIPSVLVFVVFTFFHFKFNEKEEQQRIGLEVLFLLLLTQLCLWIWAIVDVVISSESFSIETIVGDYKSQLLWTNWFVIALSFTIPIFYHLLNRNKIKTLN
ncbi:MAG: hypothetical protein ACJAWV_000555 [Flammeovirgaceae bacterium]|jgi:hypothetical protein